MKYQQIMVDLHKSYTNKTPLDLESSNEISISYWKDRYMLNIFDYTRMVALLTYHNNLNELYNSSYDFDMDNIIPIIDSLLDAKLIHFSDNLEYCIDIKPDVLETNYPTSFTIIPKNKYNQFPCDESSKKKRVELLDKKFPFATDINVGILGDDDFLSLDLVKLPKFNPIVYEIDNSIVDIIKTNGDSRIKTHNIDLSLVSLDSNDKILDTFIIDPPYNYYGAMCFIIQGIMRLRNFNEFYLIANQMMLGKTGVRSILHDLISCNIHVKEIIPCFSKYMLPKNYREFLDFKEFFLKKGHMVIDDKIVSSASSLFIFDVSEVNFHAIKSLSSQSNSIYQRYTE